MIKSLSLAAVAVLVMVGCNSGSKSSDAPSFVTKNTQAATIKGLQSLGDTVNSDSFQSVKSTADNTYSKDTSGDYIDNGQPCDSGSMTFTGGEDSPSFSLDAKNCTKDGSTINGTLSASSSEGTKKASGTVTRDFTIVDEGMNLFLAKNSHVSINDHTIDIDVKSKINNDEVSANNLSVTFTESENGATFSFSSGVVNIAGYYFEFVSQVSPFVMGNDGIESGLLKLKDGAGHKVELFVEATNQVALRIDENDDGQFSEEETLRDNFLSEDFAF